MLKIKLEDRILDVDSYEYISQNEYLKTKKASDLMSSEGLETKNGNPRLETKGDFLRTLLKNSFWFQKTNANKNVDMLVKLVVKDEEALYEVKPYLFHMVEVL